MLISCNTFSKKGEATEELIGFVYEKEFSLYNMKVAPFSYNAMEKAEISQKLRNLAEV